MEIPMRIILDSQTITSPITSLATRARAAAHKKAKAAMDAAFDQYLDAGLDAQLSQKTYARYMRLAAIAVSLEPKPKDNRP